MKPNTPPHLLYVQARDHLERAIAVLSREPGAEPLIRLLDEAVDITIELAHLPPPGETPLRLLPVDAGMAQPQRAGLYCRRELAPARLAVPATGLLLASKTD